MRKTSLNHEFVSCNGLRAKLFYSFVYSSYDNVHPIAVIVLVVRLTLKQEQFIFYLSRIVM